MYVNLKIEMLKKNMGVDRLTELMIRDYGLKCSVSNMYAKIRGESRFTMEESDAIHDIMGKELSREYLFEKTKTEED